MSILRCRYLRKWTKIQIFKLLVIPILLYGFETWILNTVLRKRIDDFGTRSLRKIMGYHWYVFVSNQRLFRETDSKPITSVVRQRLLRHDYVARYLEADPTYRVVLKMDNPAWRRSKERPQN